mmetsp:Transcript_21980/g.61119  ORF Transcript_21980/g.61119 Transcript_21980/m.61119 type:complete len:81 (+) Transcript_21980:879-1121(+)
MCIVLFGLLSPSTFEELAWCVSMDEDSVSAKDFKDNDLLEMTTHRNAMPETQQDTSYQLMAADQNGGVPDRGLKPENSMT